MEKARANAKIMDRLQTDDGEIIMDQNDILNEQVKFYSNVYKKKKEFDINLANNFTNNLNVPKISEDSKTQLENEITLDEIGQALKSTKNNSAPGNDGLTYSFLKVFWNRISKLVYDSYNASYQAGELSFSQRQAIITLLHKGKGLPRDNLSNWRPISLTNTDYKVLAKCIANRLSNVLDQIISEHQVGFVKGRKISSIIRLIDDTIENLKTSQSEGILLAVDYKRAFDSISKDYMLYAFRSFGFGENFLRWVKVLITKTESSINYLGWISESFSVESGVRQGCPFSPMAFIIGLELLSIKIRQDIDISGIILPVPKMSVAHLTALKIALYADDMTLFLKNRQDLESALIILNSFSLFSNLEMNRNKTEAMWVGSRAGCQERYGGIEWKEKLKILGIIFRNNISASQNEENWKNKIMKIKELIALWSKRNLSISGKLVIIKTFLLSQLVFLMQSLSLPENVLNSINSLFFRYIWKKKNTNTRAFEKVKRTTLCNSFDKGGINMINVKDMQNSFLLSWIINLLDSKNELWSIIPKAVFSALGPDLLCFKASVTIKHFVGVDHISSSFWKKAFIAWLDNKNKLSVYDNEHFKRCRENCLWNNEHIKYRGKSLYFKDWVQAGINYVGDFKPFGVLSYRDIVNQVGNKGSRIFEYNALCTAIWSFSARNLPVNVNQTTCFNFDRLPTAKNIRLQLVDSLSSEPCSINFWQRKYNITLSPNHWTVSINSTKEQRLRLLQWKILSNIYPTNILLQKMGVRDSNLCQTCRVIDYIEHFFFTCRRIKPVWEACQNYIYTISNERILIRETDALFGYKVNSVNSSLIRFINHMILITKLVISKYRYGRPIDLLVLFQREVDMRRKFLYYE